MIEQKINSKVVGTFTTVGKLAAIVLPVTVGVIVGTIIIRQIDKNRRKKGKGIWMG